MLNVNVLPLKVATATVNAYMLTLTFATATPSFNVLPLMLNVRKGLVPVDWQQRFYVEIAAAS